MGKKNAKLTNVKDFIFDWDVDSTSKGTGGQTIEEMKNVFYQIAAAGRVTDKEKKRLEQRRTHKPKNFKE